MDAAYKLQNQNPQLKANFITKLFFLWMIKVCRKCGKEGLAINDLFQTIDKDKSEQLGNLVQESWNLEILKAKMKNSKPSLLLLIVKEFGSDYVFQGFMLFIGSVFFKPLQSIILSELIKSFYDNSKFVMIKCCILLIITTFLIAIIENQAQFLQVAMGMRIRIGISSMIYRKILKLNSKSLKNLESGKILNLLANDVFRFDYMFTFHYGWIIFFQIPIIMYLMWYQIGASCLSGMLALILLTLPFQGYFSKKLATFRTLTATRTDSRLKLMQEILNGILVIKLYAWEKPFRKFIGATRELEMFALIRTTYFRSIFSALSMFVDKTTICITVITYVMLGNHLTPDKVFSISQLFNILQTSMIIYFSSAVARCAECYSAIKRIEAFLLLREKDFTSVKYSSKRNLTIQNLKASWDDDGFQLKNICTKIKANSLCAIVGPVGSGKSSLLNLILGEMTTESGTVHINGEISYASQEAWLFPASIQKNILFGQEYRKSRYNNIVRVCALEKDFQQFPSGDQAVVGERGVCLSGGQKARINLARAVYKNADIYLFDDPLSAVDTNVAKCLFTNCIVQYLKGKIRILVTHQLQFLRKMNHIIFMQNGSIVAQGTYEELLSNEEFKTFLTLSDDGQEKNVDKNNSLFIVKEETTSANYDYKNNDNDGESVQKIKHLKVSPIKQYISFARSPCLFAAFIIIILVNLVLFCSIDFFLAYWTEKDSIQQSNDSFQHAGIKNTTPYVYTLDNNETIYYNHYFYRIQKEVNSFFDEVIINDTPTYLIKKTPVITLYIILILFAIGFSITLSIIFVILVTRISRNIHDHVFESLLTATMRFFDTNTSGKILNKFSKDMNSVDEILPRSTILSIQQSFDVLCILVIVSLTNWYIICVLAIVSGVFYFVFKSYVHTSRVLKHLEGISKAPAFSHLNSTLDGLYTIRASSIEEKLIKQFDEFQDTHTGAWYLTLTCTACYCYGMWFSMISACVIAIIIISFTVLNCYDLITGSFAALAITHSLNLVLSVQYSLRFTSDTINYLTSVERVLQLTEIETEGPFDTSEDKPEDSWPNKGSIEFRNLSLKYVPADPPVILNLNISILPGEKIGIVGRTGAGKSSLISALFRLAPTEGTILIDGVDTKRLGLTYLRSRISIIPQEPVLFSASLRYNLDPFDEFDDDLIWHALEEVELKYSVNSLDEKVSAGGSNFSVGQRQLLCLARAILRKSKILVMDEATANVDLKTDCLIQNTIRKKFHECTVLTIAHRLNTIMDSDKVLVMDRGRMVEFDHPHLLLKLPGGYFQEMVAQTGPLMSEQLKDIALQSYINNRS